VPFCTGVIGGKGRVSAGSRDPASWWQTHGLDTVAAIMVTVIPAQSARRGCEQLANTIDTMSQRSTSRPLLRPLADTESSDSPPESILTVKETTLRIAVDSSKERAFSL
jgi:hypothetical protein